MWHGPRALAAARLSDRSKLSQGTSNTSSGWYYGRKAPVGGAVKGGEATGTGCGGICIRCSTRSQRVWFSSGRRGDRARGRSRGRRDPAGGRDTEPAERRDVVGRCERLVLHQQGHEERRQPAEDRVGDV